MFDRHLSLCPDCTSYLESYRRSMNLSVLAVADLAERSPGEIPEELVVAVLDALKRAD